MMVKNEEKTHDNNDCFYCIHCQRIKVNGIHVDWYCEHHYCLTDNVKDCDSFVHVGADDKPPKDILKMDSSFSDNDTGIYLGNKHYKMHELFQMIFQMRLDIGYYSETNRLLSKSLFDMAKQYNDYTKISKVLEKIENRRG